MKVVYVAGPYRAPTVWQVDCNIQEARRIGALVAELGAMPLIPHSNTAHMDGIQDDLFWLNGTLELLRRSDAVLLFGDWRLSSGTVHEKNTAEGLGIPVFLDLPELKYWLMKAENEDSTE